MFERSRGRRARPPRICAATLAIATLIAGCGSSATTLSPTASPSATATPGDPVKVRWFADYGGFSTAWQETEDLVKRFNASQHEIVLEITPPAMDPQRAMELMLSSGEAPDIIGPFGNNYVADLAPSLLDLSGLVKDQGFDLGQFDRQAVDLLRSADGRLLGLPYRLSPAFLFYNKDLFARAGLPDLPSRVGEGYMGQPWNWDTLASTAARLTLDGKGRTPGSPGFDAASIGQWGFAMEWWDSQRLAAAFGSASPLSADGKTVEFSAQWKDAMKWYHQAIWGSHVAPTHEKLKSPLRDGSVIMTGKVAIAAANSWSISLYRDWDAKGNPAPAAFEHWDMAVMPSWQGRTSSPTDVDVFGLMSGSKHPAEAFRAMKFIMSDDTLLAYSGSSLAASRARRPTSLSQLNASVERDFPGNQVTWSVLEEMAQHAVDPNLPRNSGSIRAAGSEIEAFFEKLESMPGLDVDAATPDLRTELLRTLSQP